MKRFLLLLLLSLSATAATVQLTWTPSTTNVDGSSIPATGSGSLTHYTLQYGSCGGTAPNYVFGTAAGQVNIPAPSATYTTADIFGPGLHCFRLSATNTFGQVSAYTNAASKNITPPIPNPPSALTVTVTTAYYLIQQINRLAFIPVGTVPASTPCDTTQSANGYYAVDRAAVTWYGSTKPQIVFAQCG